MRKKIVMIGFGEAGMAFAGDITVHAALHAFDRKTDDAATRESKRSDYERAGATGAADAASALKGSDAVLSLVTADQALNAARANAPLLPMNALWLDMNSVAPNTKRAAAEAVEAAGGRYVDVAVMAPVHPARSSTPLLVSGPHAEAGAALLRDIGFAAVRIIAGDVGRASSIKMIRSVMVKGMEALTAECILAADRAGVLEEVLASLDASPAPGGWKARADYNLDRMLVHGLRRAAEMEEVAKTLDAVGTGSTMTQGTIIRQRAIGAIGLSDPPKGLTAKLAAFHNLNKADAA